MTRMTKAALCFLVGLAIASAHAEKGVIVSRKHTGAVLALAANSQDETFFSGGEDGFVSRHTEEGQDETWQVSDMPIRLLASHPAGNLLACYESDGFTVHRLSVWDWPSKTRLYAKRFRDSVTSLAWSAKGTWLMIGNTSLDGITFLEGKSGKPKKVFSSPHGMVTLAVTGLSEASVMTFGPSGRIRYSEMSSGKQKAEYQGIADLASPVLTGNARIISGFDGTAVLSVDATTGRLVSKTEAASPLFATSPEDSSVSWFERREEETVFRSSEGISLPLLLEDRSRVTSAVGLRTRVAFGTDSGHVYTFPKANYAGVALEPSLTASGAIIPIDDVTTDGTSLYALAKGSLYALEGPDGESTLLASGLAANRVSRMGNSFLFWSTKEPLPLVQTDLSGGARKELFVPKEGISSLNHAHGVIACVEGTSSAVVIRPESAGEAYRYAGVGIQDAMPVGQDAIVIAKSATSRSPYPLIHINTATGETVPVAVSADLCFSLKRSDRVPELLFAFLVKGGSPPVTELASIHINEANIAASRVRTMATYQDEDMRATLFTGGNELLTNLGKNSLVTIEHPSGRQTKLERDYALPLKGVIVGDWYASLNYDGSISWYDSKKREVIKSRSLLAENVWAD